LTTDDRPSLDDRVQAAKIPYRSRGEARVARALDQYGILHYYELPTVVYDRGMYRVWHPDFTLPAHDGLVIEYAGMMDVPDYARGIAHKQQAYAANAIPALFVYPEDLTNPGWAQNLVERIERAGYKPTGRKYEAAQ
jgi:hypothetical protein